MRNLPLSYGDLAGIAKKYSPADLEARFLYPPDDHVTATVSLPSGKRCKANCFIWMRFYVAILDEDGWYRSWPLQEVKVQVHDPLAGHLELLHKYTDKDIHNVFSYLETLQVAQDGGNSAVGECRVLCSRKTTGVKNSIPSVSDSWPTFNGDTSGRRYSTLTQINKTNVKSLKLAWAFQTHAVTLKSTPLEIDGILYFTVPDQVWAIDAKTGEGVWEFRRPRKATTSDNEAWLSITAESISEHPTRTSFASMRGTERKSGTSP